MSITLYKFVNDRWGLDALEQRRLKASTLEDFNDPFEFNNFRFETPEVHLVWPQLRQGVYGDSGIVCLSSIWSNPVIWSHYADDHRGIAIGLECDRTAEPEKQLFEVKYQDQPTVVTNDILNDPGPEAIQLFEDGVRTKYSHWQYENEWRFVERKLDLISEVSPEAGRRLYFKEFSASFAPSHVLIGSQSNLAEDDIFKAYGDDSLQVIRTKCAMGAFEMVEV